MGTQPRRSASRTLRTTGTQSVRTAFPRGAWERLNPRGTYRLSITLQAHLPQGRILYASSEPPPPGCEPPPQVYPAIDWLPRVDLVVAGGGYNSVAECTALGIPLIAYPFPRRYDRQAAHIQAAAQIHPNRVWPVLTPAAALQTALTYLCKSHRSDCPPAQPRLHPLEGNGAKQAVQSIAAQLAAAKR